MRRASLPPLPINAPAALERAGHDYDRTLRGEEDDPRGAAARHAALRSILAHMVVLRKLCAAPDDDGVPILDLHAARAALSQHEDDPHDDDDGEAG